jgi:predicted RNA binding protein YcfA (HicA-like mRNA interferase family)
MKCSDLLRILKNDGWYVVSQKGSHIRLAHPLKTGTIIFPFHGSSEMAKGMEKKIRKLAGLK